MQTGITRLFQEVVRSNQALHRFHQRCRSWLLQVFLLERSTVYIAGRRLASGKPRLPLPVTSLLFAAISNEGVSSTSRVTLENLAHA